MSELERICRPLLMCVCDYWQYTRAGNVPDKDAFQRQIGIFHSLLNQRMCSDDEVGLSFADHSLRFLFFGSLQGTG